MILEMSSLEMMYSILEMTPLEWPFSATVVWSELNRGFITQLHFVPHRLTLPNDGNPS